VIPSQDGIGLVQDDLRREFCKITGKPYETGKKKIGRPEKGYKDEQLISPDIDRSVTFYSDGHFDTNYQVSFRKVLIDGLGIGDVGTTVLRDRKTLAEDGMFSVVLLVNSQTGQLHKDPVVLSRGFVFMKENTDLIDYLKKEVTKKFQEVTSSPPNFEYIREQIQAYIETLVLDKTGRQPMVLPLIIQV